MPPRKCCHLPYLPQAPDGHRPPTTHAWKPTQKESLSEGRHWSLCEPARSRVIQRHMTVLSAVLARLADSLSVWEGSASPCDLPAAVQMLPLVPRFLRLGEGRVGERRGVVPAPQASAFRPPATPSISATMEKALHGPQDS